MPSAALPCRSRLSGVEGVRFDAFVEDLPKGYHGVWLGLRVDLFELSDAHIHVIFEGETQRLIVLQDVRGEPVTVVFARKASKFDKVWPEAQKVIDSVQWEDPKQPTGLFTGVRRREILRLRLSRFLRS